MTYENFIALVAGKCRDGCGLTCGDRPCGACQAGGMEQGLRVRFGMGRRVAADRRRRPFQYAQSGHDGPHVTLDLVADNAPPDAVGLKPSEDLVHPREEARMYDHRGLVVLQKRQPQRFIVRIFRAHAQPATQQPTGTMRGIGAQRLKRQRCQSA